MTTFTADSRLRQPPTEWTYTAGGDLPDDVHMRLIVDLSAFETLDDLYRHLQYLTEETRARWTINTLPRGQHRPAVAETEGQD